MRTVRIEPTKADISISLEERNNFSQLRYELPNCKSAWSRYGFGAAPYDLREAVISMDALVEADPYWESAVRIMV